MLDTWIAVDSIMELKTSELTTPQAVAAALRMLCSDLLIELEKPLSSSTPHLPEVLRLPPSSKSPTDIRF
jgi:hypothetical protein